MVIFQKKYPRHIKEDRKYTVKKTLFKDEKITFFDKLSKIIKRFI